HTATSPIALHELIRTPQPPLVRVEIRAHQPPRLIAEDTVRRRMNLLPRKPEAVHRLRLRGALAFSRQQGAERGKARKAPRRLRQDRKSTRLNSSHVKS